MLIKTYRLLSILQKTFPLSKKWPKIRLLENIGNFIKVLRAPAEHILISTHEEFKAMPLAGAHWRSEERKPTETYRSYPLLVVWTIETFNYCKRRCVLSVLPSFVSFASWPASLIGVSSIPFPIILSQWLVPDHRAEPVCNYMQLHFGLLTLQLYTSSKHS